MQLFIWTPGICMEVSDITLLDGCIPSVSDGNRGIPLSQLPQIEPAVWFKVLMLAEISIDCGKRVVMWTFNNLPDLVTDHQTRSVSPGEMSGIRTTAEPAGVPQGVIRRSRTPTGRSAHGVPQGADGRSRTRPVPFDLSRLVRQHLSESVYEDGEFVGDDMLEVFSSLKKLTSDYVEESIDIEMLHEELLRLLHRFILPAIAIRPEHLPQARAAHSTQQQHIHKIDQDITSQNNKIDLLHRSRIRCLNKFVECVVQADAEKLDLGVEFAEILRADVERELQVMGVRSDKQSTEKTGDIHGLDIARDAGGSKEWNVTKDEGEGGRALLTRGSRVLRDYITRQKAKRTVRVITRKPSSETLIESPLRDIYLEMKNGISEMRSIYQELVDKKVLTISVLGAINNSIEELRVNPGTVGMETDKVASSRSTDVLLPSSISPEWLTLEGKLARLLADLAHPLAVRYNKLCGDIIDICQGCLKGKNITDLSLSDSYRWSLSLPSGDQETRAAGTGGGSPDGDTNTDQLFIREEDEWLTAGRRNSEVEAMGDITCNWPRQVAMFDTKEINCLKALSHLKYLIGRHVDKMTVELSEELAYEISVRGEDRVRLRYESHIYQATFSNLIQVYKAAYHQIHASLFQLLPEISLDDINLQDSLATKMVARSAAPSKNERQTDLTGSRISVSGDHSINRGPDLETRLSSMGITDNVVHTPGRDSTESASQKPAGVGQSDDSAADGAVQGFKRSGRWSRSSVKIHFRCPAYKASVRRRASSDSTESSNNNVNSKNTSATDLGSTDHKEGRLVVLPRYQPIFQQARDILLVMLEEKIPLLKFRYLKDCVQLLTEQVGRLEGKELASHDILDLVVVLLLADEAVDTPQLYLHIMLLDDLIPKCLELGTFCYSLIKFRIAFEYILDCVERKRQNFEMTI